jgi:O-antigen/teichoic acid export membrane protein
VSPGPLRRLTGDTLVYGLGHVASQILGLVFVPVFTRLLAVGDYGVLGTTNVIFYLLTVLVPLGLGQAAVRHVFDEKDPEEQRRLLGTGLVGCLLLAGIATPVLVAVAPLVSTALFGDTGRTDVLRLAFLAVPGAAVRYYALSVLRARFRKWAFGGLTLLSVLLQGSFNVLLVVVLRLGVGGVFLGGLIALTSVGALSLVLIRKDVRPCFSGARLRRLLAYGAPLVPASVAFWALASLDRTLLVVIRGEETVGLYEVGGKVAAIASFATFAITQAYVPLSFEMAGRDDADRHYGRVLLAYLAGMGGLALLLAAFAEETVGLLAAPDFARGAVVVPWLVSGVALAGAGTILATGIHLAKRTIWVTWAAAAAAILNLALNLLWIPGWGMVGAAAATLASYAVMNVVLTVVAQKLRPVPYPWGRAALLAGLAGAGILVSAYVEPWWGRALIVAGFGGVGLLSLRPSA